MLVHGDGETSFRRHSFCPPFLYCIARLSISPLPWPISSGSGV